MPLILRDRKRVKRLISLLVIVAAFLTIPYMMSWQPQSTKGFVFNHFNHLAYYLCLAIMASHMLLTTMKQSRKDYALWLVMFSLLTAALVLNTSLGPYLAVIGGLVLSMVFNLLHPSRQMEPSGQLQQTRELRQLRQFRWRLALPIVLFIGMTIAINLFINYLGNDLLNLGRDLANIAQGKSEASSAGTGRWNLWQLGLKYVAEKPIFGYGPDNLGARYLIDGISPDGRPHNEFIQFAAMLGIPGLLFYVAGLLAHLSDFLKRWRRLDLAVIGVFATVGAYLISSLFGNTMFYTTPFFFMFLGLSYGMLRNPEWEIERD